MRPSNRTQTAIINHTRWRSSLFLTDSFTDRVRMANGNCLESSPAACFFVCIRGFSYIYQQRMGTTRSACLSRNEIRLVLGTRERCSESCALLTRETGITIRRPRPKITKIVRIRGKLCRQIQVPMLKGGQPRGVHFPKIKVVCARVGWRGCVGLGWSLMSGAMAAWPVART